MFPFVCLFVFFASVWLAQNSAAGGAAPSSRSFDRRRGQKPGGNRDGTKAGANRKRKASAEIFEKYGWNKMESHFPIL